LVNLKRPTLRLCPLQIHPSDNPSDDPANTESRNIHTLEFEYDCDAPKCNITIQVIVPSNELNPHGNSRPSGHRITVYESVFEGGFSRLLKFEDGATIDLGRFEHVAAHGAQVLDPDNQSSHRLNKDPTTTEIPELPELSSHPSVTPSPTPDHPDNARKRRFTTLHFRRRSTNHSVSGPALAVVDGDAAVSTEAREREKDTHDDDGVRVVIQLVALDDFGKELSSSNRQSTYLHVVRLGSPASGSEDNRSWVVKVVKREATASTSHFTDAHIRLTHGPSPRLARIHSIYMKFTDFLRPRLKPPYQLQVRLHTHIHLRFRLLRMSHRLNASSVSVHPVRWSFCHVVTLSRVKNVPSIWSNLVLAARSCMRRSRPRSLNRNQPRPPRHPLSMALCLRQQR
jgi:hypothetical protein